MSKSYRPTNGFVGDVVVVFQWPAILFNSQPVAVSTSMILWLKIWFHLSAFSLYIFIYLVYLLLYVLLLLSFLLNDVHSVQVSTFGTGN